MKRGAGLVQYAHEWRRVFIRNLQGMSGGILNKMERRYTHPGCPKGVSTMYHERLSASN